MKAKMPVFVYGAYGHTGQFVLRELERRGWNVVAAGRDGSRLDAVAARSERRILPKAVAVTDATGLLEAARGTAAIVNCAGPFQDTAWPLIETALKLQIPYLDITGEADVVAKVFSDFDGPARAAGVSIMSGVGFYGGLGDILTTAVAGDWKGADAVSIGFALDGWKPTPGTRNVLQRMGGRRTVFRGGKSVQLNGQPQFAEREFSGSVGKIPVMVDYPGPEGTLIASHFEVPDVTNYMAVAALKDLRDPATTGPVAIDETGRSDQKFHIDVEIRNGDALRRGWIAGTDIYATTAPIVVDALERAIAKGKLVGAISPGGAFDAVDFLRRLQTSNMGVQVSICEPADAALKETATV